MIPKLVRQIAARQHGVASRTQILDAGMSEKAIELMVAGRVVDLVHRGVYGLPGSPRTFEFWIMAAILAAGGRCVASHSAAAFVLGLGEISPRVEIAVPRDQCPKVQGARLHYPRHLPESHVTRKGPIPVTTAARTICDLASALKRPELERLLDHALVRKNVTCEEIRAVLADLRQGRGRGLIRSLLDERPDGQALVESPLEQELQTVLKEEGLGSWRAQRWLEVGGERYRVDVVFPDAKLALEVQSYRHHSSRTDWAHDQTRSAGLVAAGWRVFPVTKESLSGAGRARFVKMLRAALASIGASVDEAG
jgi:very-short-patch-repair endonuclease